MLWPPWFWATSKSDGKSDDPAERRPASPSHAWTPFVSAPAITTAGVGVGVFILAARGYKRYLRRIPNVNYLKPEDLRRRSLYGYVTRVGDGDNFHLFHTPGGRLAGWGWFPGRRMGHLKELKDKTIHVRIAGIDAPECAHFGRPEQPFSKDALEWLRTFLLHRYVRAFPQSRDQYNRVVCTVSRKTPLWFASDVGLSMLKTGLATVYEAKTGSEFGGKEAQYRAAESRAQKRGLGMWREPGIVGKLLGRSPMVETPRAYKTRTAGRETSK